MSQPTSNGFDAPCVMDWDSTSYTSTVPHCLRRTDTGKTTDDLTVRSTTTARSGRTRCGTSTSPLGREKANTLILEAQFTYAPGTSFKAAATKTVTTAKRLYGTQVANQVRASFTARKIL